MVTVSFSKISTKISFFLSFLLSNLLIGFWIAVLDTVDDLKILGFQELEVLMGFFPCWIRTGSFTMYYRMFSVVTS